MDDNAVREAVNKALAEEFELDPADLVESAHIRADLDLDSLDLVDMVIVLEKAFHFKLPSREALAEIQTLGDIYVFICSLRDSGIVPDEN